METRNFAIFAKAIYCYNSDYVVEHSRMLYEKEFEKSFILKGIEKTLLKAFPKSVKILDKKCTLERIEFEIYPNFDNDISFFVHFTYYNYDKIILM
ncbi:MAG: hypothetical protein N2067_10110, partial [Spirochaetaceae bacterium]|nr:hypothetical protein [Spirochaetaceae bacterium]